VCNWRSRDSDWRLKEWPFGEKLRCRIFASYSYGSTPGRIELKDVLEIIATLWDILGWAVRSLCLTTELGYLTARYNRSHTSDKIPSPYSLSLLVNLLLSCYSHLSILRTLRSIQQNTNWQHSTRLLSTSGKLPAIGNCNGHSFSIQMDFWAWQGRVRL
jgi:hypothetical protein